MHESGRITNSIAHLRVISPLLVVEYKRKITFLPFIGIPGRFLHSLPGPIFFNVYLHKRQKLHYKWIDKNVCNDLYTDFKRKQIWVIMKLDYKYQE